MTAADWAVDDRDEGSHEPGGERLWNESWYADFVTADGSLGGYLRLGLSPNQGSAWVLVALAGPGRPTVLVDDKGAPLPGEGPVQVTTSAYRFALQTVEPLRSWRVHGEGRGSSFPDPAGILRGEQGADCALALDLTWTTDGEPYRYPVGTRYEIPCLVSGTVTLGGEVHHLSGAVGQRDHSWGVRDWEQATWCWSACRLDDGTRAHLTRIDLPGLRLDLGYLQRVGGMTAVGTCQAVHGDAVAGLPSGSHLLLRPSGPGEELGLDVTPLAHAPTTVPTSSGAPQPFPRAMARFRVPDGREGLGWIEWNGLPARAENAR
ncbi:MAG: hypothetical protein WCD35_11695 [Mycobacteriales bacterium]